MKYEVYKCDGECNPISVVRVCDTVDDAVSCALKTLISEMYFFILSGKELFRTEDARTEYINLFKKDAESACSSGNNFCDELGFVFIKAVEKPYLSMRTTSVDKYRCPNCGKEFLDLYGGESFYCDYCGYEDIV